MHEIVQHPFLPAVLRGGDIFPVLWHTGLFPRTAEHFLTGENGNGLWQAQGTAGWVRAVPSPYRTSSVTHLLFLLFVVVIIRLPFPCKAGGVSVQCALPYGINAGPPAISFGSQGGAVCAPYRSDLEATE